MREREGLNSKIHCRKGKVINEGERGAETARYIIERVSVINQRETGAEQQDTL